MPISENDFQKLPNYSKDDVLQGLLKERFSISDLDIEKRNHVLAAKEFMCLKPSVIEFFNNETEKKFLIELLKDDRITKSDGSMTYVGYKFFSNVKTQFMDSDIINAYLYRRLIKEIDISNNLPIHIDTSNNGEIVIKFNYQPQNGSQIVYFDNDVKMPLSLIPLFNFTFKINDSLLFINKFGIDAKTIGLNTICSYLQLQVKKYSRDSINKVLISNNIGYYGFSSKYTEIENSISDSFNADTKITGITCTEIELIELAFLENDVNKIISNQFLSERIKSLNEESRIAYEKASLDNFERKAEILSKFPELKDTLTEAEKDNAFRRYGLVEGLDFVNEEYVSTTKKTLEKRTTSFDSSLGKYNDSVITEKEEVDGKQILYILGRTIFGLLGFIFFVVGLSSGSGTSFIISGFSLAILGLLLFGYNKYKAFKDPHNNLPKEKLEGEKNE